MHFKLGIWHFLLYCIYVDSSSFLSLFCLSSLWVSISQWSRPMCAGSEPSIQKRTGRLLWHQHRHGCKLSINQNMEEFSSLDLFLYSFFIINVSFFVCTFNAHWLFIMPVTARMSLSVQSVALLLWPFIRPSFCRSFCFVFDGQFLLVSLSFVSSESYEFGSFQCRVLVLVITALKVGKKFVYLNAYSRYTEAERQDVPAFLPLWP